MRFSTLASRMGDETPVEHETRADGLGVVVFTTGQIARMCHVASRTVSKWFDSGRLKGYRIPGITTTPRGTDRRVPRANLIAFLAKEGLPIPQFLRTGIALAVCLEAADTAGLPGWEVADEFGAGLHIATRPIICALIGDSCGLAMALRIASSIRSTQPAASVMLVVSESAADEIPWSGLLERRPVDVARLGAGLMEGK